MKKCDYTCSQSQNICLDDFVSLHSKCHIDYEASPIATKSASDTQLCLNSLYLEEDLHDFWDQSCCPLSSELLLNISDIKKIDIDRYLCQAAEETGKLRIIKERV